MQRDYELLKSVLSVPSKTYQEERMVKFLTDWFTENNFPFFVDKMNNIYVTKQTDENVEHFPCVVAHTDTVHNIDTINIREGELPNAQNVLKPALKAYNDEGKPTGIGGDDKCGIYACLELLKELPNLKAAFFVSEETGCHGSRNADKEFFSNVGYVIEFDAPGNWMVSEYCMGVQLFGRDTEFFKSCNESLVEGFGNRQKYQAHPYTDVYALRQLFDFACINFSIGYYNYHTPNEYVVIEDVYSGIETGKKMIERLGNTRHTFIPKQKQQQTLFG
jgi:di/tripeptidase